MCSPEIVRGVKYSKEVDIWSYGCFAYELLTNTPPFFKYLKNGGKKALMDAILQ